MCRYAMNGPYKEIYACFMVQNRSQFLTHDKLTGARRRRRSFCMIFHTGNGLFQAISAVLYDKTYKITLFACHASHFV